MLQLTTGQRSSFDAWSAAKLSELAAQYDVDTNESQKHVSLGPAHRSTLGALAICAAVVLFFSRFWGYQALPPRWPS